MFFIYLYVALAMMFKSGEIIGFLVGLFFFVTLLIRG